MQKHRAPAVAGLFYSDDKATLQADITSMLYQAKQTQTDFYKPKAVIAPHAGFIYSGPIAASAYHHLIPIADTINQIILLGPSHRVAFDGCAVPTSEYFITPLGQIEIDHTAVNRLIEGGQARFNDDAHEHEHSLEVQLPFLQTILDDFKIVPIVVGDANPENVASIFEYFSSHAMGESIFVVSSDLSHFLDYPSAKARDKFTNQAIEEMSYDEIGPHDACGCNPIAGLLYWTKRHQLSVTNIDLRNSGDTAGTRDRVVGYGAYIIE